MLTFPFSVDVQVRGYELDPWGHVNNAVYLNWLEHARWEMSRQGDGFSSFSEGVLPVVRHLDLDFKHETLLGDWLKVSLWPRTLGNTSFKMGACIRITAADDASRIGQIALLATKVFTCIRRPDGKVPVPADWRSIFPAVDPGPEPPENT